MDDEQDVRLVADLLVDCGLPPSLIRQHASIQALAGAGEADLAAAGWPPTAIRRLRTAMRFAQRLLEPSAPSPPQKWLGFLAARLGCMTSEMLAVLLLDSADRVIGFRELSRGDHAGCPFRPPAVVSTALRASAAAIILVHNHPSGIAQFSKRDVAFTSAVADAAAVVDIALRDHLLVAGERVVALWGYPTAVAVTA